MLISPVLEVNLAAIARNYKLLSNRLKSGRCAGVVKANAYGLGVKHIVPALYEAGCRDFFVATLEEGVELRKIVESGELQAANIYVFHGIRQGQGKDFAAHHLIPVLNSREQIGYWNNAGPYAVHIDTGMNRLGLNPDEIKGLSLSGCKLVMSHLACANEPQHPKNHEQLAAFTKAIRHFPGVTASLANSSGVFLSEEYHFDLARPGCSLYGISPNTSLPNPMENVVTLSAPILQYRHIKKPETVGYGAMGQVPAGAVLATVELGYADGFPRILSNKMQGFAADVAVPVIGRISMDMVIVDVSRVPEALRTPDMRITFIGKEQTVDVIAKAASTIGYEIFTRLGSRIKRVYLS